MNGIQTSSFVLQLTALCLCILTGLMTLIGRPGDYIIFGLLLWFCLGGFQLANAFFMAVKYSHRGFTLYFFVALLYSFFLFLAAYNGSFALGTIVALTFVCLLPALAATFYLLYYRQQCVLLNEQDSTLPPSDSDILDDDWQSLR